MEGVHSYEDRSSSELGHELHSVQNRAILVNRREPELSWSAQNQPPGGEDGQGFGWCSCGWPRRLLASRCCHGGDSNRSRGPGSLSLSNSSFMGANNYDMGPFASNEWRTSKYTLLTFLPKNLFEQFRRLANFYFLATAILQIVIPYSPVGPMTSLLPLVFVVATSAFKQAYEDYLRHKIDKEVNNRTCHVLRNKRLQKVRSKDIRVGDFVYVRNNEEIPCDMVLLAASGHGDRCYITTANLDGESSLKSRTCFQITKQMGPIDQLDNSLLIVECETPNATLYEFNGYLRSPKSEKFYELLVSQAGSGGAGTNTSCANGNSSMRRPGANLSIPQVILNRIKCSKSRTLPSPPSSLSSNTLGKNASAATAAAATATESLLNNLSEFHEIPLDISNLLLRASRLRNTSFIYGLAIYTGRDTKLAHNSHVKPNKFSSSERRVNLFLVMSFMLLLAFSLIGSINYRRSDYSYIVGLKKIDSFGKIFMAHFLVYNYLMPISLYVTLEFIKFLGTKSVVGDGRMKISVWQTITAQSNDSSTIQKSLDNQLQIKNHANNNNNSNNKSDTLSSLGSSKRVKTIEGPKCNSSDLNEELGQIEVLFSDKTGTLTENKMRFMACSTYGQLYRSVREQLYLQPANLYKAPIANLASRLAKVTSGRQILLTSGAANNTITNPLRRNSTDTKQESEFSQQQQQQEHKPFDHRLVPPLDKLRLIDQMDQHERMVELFICLCLCSTITLNETLPLMDCLPDRTSNDYDYQSASPDEESLISAAHLFGVTMCKSNDQDCYIVISRSQNKTTPSTTTRTKTARNLKSPARVGKFDPLLDGKNSTDRYIVRHFKRLQVFEFNSIRKRMSAIYRDCDNDCIIMVTKGSEELLDCLALDRLDANSENCINITLAHFEAFALSGLRTLLVARRVVSKQDYEQIEESMREARQSIQNRDHLLSRLYRRAENGLRLIGATAVEDTLQEGVPETIASLKGAGIKVWLLTGDKVETAISVAYLCRLLDREMTLFHLVRQQDVQSCQKLLQTFDQQLKASSSNNDDTNLLNINSSGSSIISKTRTRTRTRTRTKTKSKSTTKTKTKTSSQRPGKSRMGPTASRSGGASGGGGGEFREEKFALIADGRSLYYAMKYAKVDLARLCHQCTCVLGCRLSPLQKAEVVDMLKQSDSKPITAAIGDGANDVSMIQEAHVGIGVSGKEGKQAVNCSDFAISRFYMLNRLLFVHGHLFYHRTAHTIHYFFYKNLLFMVPQFLYSFYNLTSAQSLYPPILLICFNLIFTSLPILLYGLFEIHIPELMLEQNPKLYRMNKGNRLLSLKVFLEWLSLAAVQATIGFYILYFNLAGSLLDPTGQTDGVNEFAMIVYFVVILTATIKLYFLSRNHSIYFNLSVLGSLLSLPLLLYAYSLVGWGFLIEDNSLYGRMQVYLVSPMFWLAVMTTTAATLVPDIIVYILHRIQFFRELNSLMGTKQQYRQPASQKNLT